MTYRTKTVTIMLKHLCRVFVILCCALTLQGATSSLAWTTVFELERNYGMSYDDLSQLYIGHTVNGDTQTVFSDDFCSEPAVSPDKTKAAFLYPYDFEAISDLMLFDTANGELTLLELDDIPFQHTPMRITWLNDHILLVVVGYGYGTITWGGNLYYYDLNSGANARLTNVNRVEITNAAVMQEGVWLDLLGQEYGFVTGRYYHILPRIKTRELLPLEDLNRLIKEPGLTAKYAEKSEDAVVNRLMCLAGWLLWQTAQNM